MDQLQISQDILKNLNEISKILEEIVKKFEQINNINRSISEAQAKSKENLEDSLPDLEEFNKQLEESASLLDKFKAAFKLAFPIATRNVNQFMDTWKEASEKYRTITKVFGVRTFFLAGVFRGLSNTIKLLSFSFDSLFSIIGDAIGVVKQLALSIIGAPFKILTALIDLADKFDGTELMQALEDIRKEFGSLKETAGKAIIDMARSMKGQLANTGLSVWRTFGNLANRLRTIMEYAKELGSIFENMIPSLVKSAEAFGAFNKGLGLTGEGLHAVGVRAYATGNEITEIQRQIANYSLQLGKAFNISSKLISRDVGTLMADFKHFGNLSAKELAQAVVYARKLGIEIKDLTGVLDKYDNFEEAAQGAAHLSQAFGLNIDALQMIKAQNPAERIEQLRKAFFAAGRTIENMTRQERALLAQHTGLSEETLDLVFSIKNQSLSYEEIQKKGAMAEKRQLSQAEALKKLADSIERLVQQMHSSGGFFDRFIDGFEKGIFMSSSFMRLIINLKRDLYAVHWAGIRVGLMFVEFFPGVKNIIKSMADFFNPARFRSLLNKIVDSFREFFLNLTRNPNAALPELFKRLKRDFLSFFQLNEPNGRRLLEGYKSFFKALLTIGGSLLKETIRGATQVVRFLIDLITGRTSLNVGSKNEFVKTFEDIIKSLVDFWKSAGGPQLLEALKELGKVLWEKLKEVLADVFSRYKWYIIGAFLGGPAIQGLTTAFISLIIAKTGKLADLLTGSLVNAIKSRTKNVAQEVASSVSNAAQQAVSQAESTAAQATEAAGKASEAAEKANVKSSAVSKLKTAALVLGGIVLVIGAVLLLAAAVKRYNISEEQVTLATKILLYSATLFGAIGLLTAALSYIPIGTNVGNVLTGFLTIFAIASVIAVSGLNAILLFRIFKEEDINKAAKILDSLRNFFLAATAISVIAGILGTIITVTGGIAAAVIGAGLAFVLGVVTALTTKGIEIINTIARANFPSGYEPKIRTFVEFMKAVGEFAKNIAILLFAARSNFLSVQKSTNDKDLMKNSLDLITGVIESFTNSTTKLINEITRAINEIGNETKLRAASAIINIIGSITSLINAIVETISKAPEPGLLDRILGNADAHSNALYAISFYISSIMNNTKAVISGIKDIIKDLGNAEENKIKTAGEVLARVLSSTGELINSLMPAIRSGVTVVTSSGDSKKINDAINSLNRYIQVVFTAIAESNLFNRIKDLIRNVSTTISGLNIGNLEVLRSMAKIIEPLLNAVAGITSMITAIGRMDNISGGDMYQAANAARERSGMIYNLTQLLNEIFTKLQESIPLLINNIYVIMASIPGAKIGLISQGINLITKVFEAISKIPDLIEKIKNISSTTGGGIDISGFINTMNSLFPSGQNEGIINVFRNIITNISSLGANISSANLDNVARGMLKVKRIFEAINESMVQITSFSSNVSTNTITTAANTINSIITSNLFGNLSQLDVAMQRIDENISRKIRGYNNMILDLENSMRNINQLVSSRESGLSAEISNFVRTRIRDIVAAVNETTRELASINNININTKLQRIANNLGLKAEETYRIENRHFNINVNVTIKFDNEALDAFELALINRTTPTKTRLYVTRPSP